MPDGPTNPSSSVTDSRDKPPKPRVFASYSHTSEAHKTWVRELCERLVANGVDVALDQWDLREGQDKNAFMEQMVVDPTIAHVLVICDARYQEKANQREGGAGTEGQIISERVYTEVHQRKFLPIVREYADAGPCVPVFLESLIHFDFATDQLEAKNFESLLRAIFDKPLYRKPPAGEPPAFVTDERHATGLYLRPLVMKFRQLAESGSPAATGGFDDYLKGLTEALSALKLTENPQGRQIHEEVFSRLSETISLRDEFVETVAWAMELSNADEYLPRLKRFFQQLKALRGNPQREGVWNDSWDDALDFATYELYLYYVAILLDGERLTRAGEWLRIQYVVLGHNAQRVRYGVFRPDLRSFYVWNDQRTPTKWLSPIGQVLKQRASNSVVLWGRVAQADLTLWLKATVDGENWWPHTSPYGAYGSVLPMYVGAEEEEVWTPLMNFLGVATREALREAVEVSWQRMPIQYSGDGGVAGESVYTQLNLQILFGQGE